MGEGKEIKKSSMSQKKRAKKLFQWTKEEELNLLKNLAEFTTNKMADEQFYPLVRNGSLAEVSKIEIFDKIQQLRKKYLEKKLDANDMRDGAFELSKRIWRANETETGIKTQSTETESASTSKALDDYNMSYFENLFESHGLELHLFTPSFLEATKKEVDELFSLQNRHFLIKANLKAQLAQLKCHIIQTRFKNHTN